MRARLRRRLVCLLFLPLLAALLPSAASAWAGRRHVAVPHAAYTSHRPSLALAHAGPRLLYRGRRAYVAWALPARHFIPVRHAAYWRHRPSFALARPGYGVGARRAAYGGRAGVAASAVSGVIAEASRYIGAGNVTGMRGPWCADYASMVLRHTGHRPLSSRNAASALAYGPRVRQPRPGDLVVLGARSGYAAHVGFFAGWQGGQVLMVSGNWGHRVSRATIAPRSIVAFIGV